MHPALKSLLWVLGSLAGLVALVAVLGFFLPREHHVSRSLRLPKTAPGKAWSVITDHAEDPAWRGDVARTERLADAHGHPVWRDHFKNGQSMSYETAESIPNEKLVRVILDSGGPFGGTWTYQLKPEGVGTRITITEDGWVSNPIFRVVGKFVIGYHATLEGYLKNLAARCGEDTAPEKAP